MKKALIIDDSAFMKSKLKEILQECDIEVIGEAGDGKEGVAAYKELKPELVFLDINMPVLSGKDALMQIIDFDSDAKVIMCSTLGSEDIVEECIEEGAIFYIIKPFIKETVIESLAELQSLI